MNAITPSRFPSSPPFAKEAFQLSWQLISSLFVNIKLLLIGMQFMSNGIPSSEEIKEKFYRIFLLLRFPFK
jgi:hypothetical protein